MGKIRIALFRDSTAEHVQEDVAPLPLKTAKAHSQADEDKAQELEGLPSYPTQPKTARFDQLPFITADEVVKRDGTRGSDICMLDFYPLANTNDSDQCTGIVVDNVVLDVTQYQHQHPGGSSIVRGFAGQDCSWQVSFCPCAIMTCYGHQLM
jgi:hypothetical protein